MYRTKRKNRLLYKSARIALALLIMIAFFISAATFVAAEEDEDGITIVDGLPCKSGEVIVKLSDTDTSKLEFVIEEIDDGPGNGQKNALATTDVPEGQTVESYIDELNNTPGVEYAQPNYIYEIDTTSVNDPLVLNDTQWYLEKIGIYDAWDVTMGSSNIIVAVLDSGVDLDHEDLVGQIVAHTDVVDNDGSAEDVHGHGTHVSGIIAAVADNAKGVAGIAPGVKLIVVDVFNGEEASTSDIIEGLTYATEQGARVVNMSFGGYGDDQLFEEAIDSAVAAGIVCVGAAGNDNNADAHYPSDYDSCISVISVDDSDIKSSFSNYGSTKDISAPGEEIASTYLNGGYAYMSGTSMAAPVISGVVALMLSVNPSLTVAEVKQILYDTAIDLGTAGKDNVYANGRVDAEAAVAQAAQGAEVLYVQLNKSVTKIALGQQETLVATVLPSTAIDKTLSWSSDNEAVATVVNGVVTPVSEGSATITVTTNDGGYTDTCTVNVVIGAQSVSLNAHEAQINAGGSVTLTATVLPAEATDKSVTWTSSDTNVATVENGIVTGVGGGSATITVTTNDGGYTDTCAVSVEIKALSVSLDIHEKSISIGESLTLTATVLPSIAPDKTVTWSSDNEAVATVLNGVVTPVSLGSANITVTTNDGGHTDTCAVNVVVRAQSVSLNTHEANINVGESAALTATVLPAEATDKSIIWTSSDTNVATVENGIVTGVGGGSSTITATTNDGGYTDTCTVSVAVVEISSSVYAINQSAGTLSYVLEGTSVSSFKSGLTNNPENVFVYSADGTLYTGNNIGTGMSVRYIVNGETTDELTIIVKGDCNGDGKISIADYTLTRLDILKLKAITGAFSMAADINADGKVSIADYTLVRLHILKLKTIS